MPEWVDRLVAKVTPSDPKPVVVIDPHGLLRYHECTERVQAAGFKLHFSDPGIRFRFFFELVGRGNPGTMIVVTAEYEPLNDIRLAASVVYVDLQSLFPHFDPRALAGLSYNGLCTIDSLRLFDKLGYESTVRFLLENLYRVDFRALDTFRSKERVLAAIADVILDQDPPNRAITEWLNALAKTTFGNKVAAEILTPLGLRTFLQGKWEQHVRGNDSLDFTEPALQLCANRMFVSGQLEPVLLSSSEIRADITIDAIGLRIDGQRDDLHRFETLIARLASSVSTIQNQHSEWLELAPVLGEAGNLAVSVTEDSPVARYRDTLSLLNDRFQLFVHNQFNGLQSLSGKRRPFTIHKIMEYMGAQAFPRIAFVMIDSMSVIQWFTLRNILEAEGLSVKDGASFAWLPSITAWSRQAFFRGAKPRLDEGNSKEDVLFRDYWKTKGRKDYQIDYKRFGVGQPWEVPAADTTVVAYVTVDVDSLLHGAIMGMPQLLSATNQWYEQVRVVELIKGLKNVGYTVCITSDHGNIAAKGVGILKLPDRNLSVSRSKRHLQLPSSVDANRFKGEHPELKIEIRDTSVYLMDESAFSSRQTEMTHGGSHLHELIIPVGVIL